MEQTKFTAEEFEGLKALIARTKDYLADADLHLVWESYKKISGNLEEPRPCSCGSAASHWKKAVDSIRTYINEVEN